MTFLVWRRPRGGRGVCTGEAFSEPQAASDFARQECIEKGAAYEVWAGLVLVYRVYCKRRGSKVGVEVDLLSRPLDPSALTWIRRLAPDRFLLLMDGPLTVGEREILEALGFTKTGLGTRLKWEPTPFTFWRLGTL